MKQYFSLKKNEVKLGDLQYMNPKLFIVLGHFLAFCNKNSLPCVITNITKKFTQSISDTHPTGRAIDISVNGWTEINIQQCENYMNDIAGHLGAISSRTGDKNLFVYHDAGLGKHIHLQVFR